MRLDDLRRTAAFCRLTCTPRLPMNEQPKQCTQILAHNTRAGVGPSARYFLRTRDFSRSPSLSLPSPPLPPSLSFSLSPSLSRPLSLALSLRCLFLSPLSRSLSVSILSSCALNRDLNRNLNRDPWTRRAFSALSLRTPNSTLNPKP